MVKKHLLCLILAVVMLFSLSACGDDEDILRPTAPQPKGGTLYIQVNPEIAVTYDAEGNVTAVTAVTEDAKAIVDSYQDYVGRECTLVVSELVTKIGEAGYLSSDAEEVQITVTFEENSGLPSDDFTEELRQQIQTIVTDNQWQGTVTVEEIQPDPTQPPTTPGGETTEPTTGSVPEPTQPDHEPEATQPDHEPEATQPDHDPESPRPDNVPDTAQRQEDGTYLLREESVSGHTVTIYDAAGQKMSRSDFNTAGAMVLTEQYEYHANGQMASRVRMNGNQQILLNEVYDNTGKVQSSAEYYASGKLKKHCGYDETGRYVESSYLENGTLTKRITRYTVDGKTFTDTEQWRSLEDGSSQYSVSRNGPDSNGENATWPVYVEETRPDGTGDTTEWDESGNVISESSTFFDVDGKKWTRSLAFWPNGNLKYSERYASDGSSEIKEYGESGNWIRYEYASVDQDGNKVTGSTIFWPNGNPKRSESYSSNGSSDITEYNENGIEVRYESVEVDSNGKKTVSVVTFWPNGNNKRTESSSSDGTGYTTEWDENGKIISNVITFFDAEGKKWTRTSAYWPNGKLKHYESYASDGSSEIQEYDENGNQIRSESTIVDKDGSKRRSIYTYWPNGKLKRSESYSFDGSISISEYDENGNMISEKNIAGAAA